MDNVKNPNDLVGILSKIENMPQAMHPTMFDGFVAGLLSSAEKISPLEWVPLALGQPNFWNIFTAENLQYLLDGLVIHFNSKAWVLLEKDSMYEVSFAPNNSTVADHQLWSNGFFSVKLLRPIAFDCYESANKEVRQCYDFLEKLKGNYSQYQALRIDTCVPDIDLRTQISSAVSTMYNWLELQIVPNGPLQEITWKSFGAVQDHKMYH